MHFVPHERYRVDESELCIYHCHYCLDGIFLLMLDQYSPWQNCNNYEIFVWQDPDSIFQEYREVLHPLTEEGDTLYAPYKRLNFA